MMRHPGDPVQPAVARLVMLRAACLAIRMEMAFFDSGDLVLVLQAGKYEDDIPNNTTFEEGDWNGDGDFDTLDLVEVFRIGHYVAGARPHALDRTSDDVAAALVLNTARADDRGSRNLLRPETDTPNVVRAVQLPIEQAVDQIFDELADGIEDVDEDDANLLLGEESL